jgi:ketopantoate reductase
MEALDAFMQGAGFDARLSRAIDYEMWEKWTLLTTIGGITCLMRGNIGEVVAALGGTAFILDFLDEVVSVVSAAGQAPKAAFVEGARKTLTTPGSTQAPSMFRDLQQGSPIEADQIIGDLLARRENGHRHAASRGCLRAHVRLSASVHELMTHECMINLQEAGSVPCASSRNPGWIEDRANTPPTGFRLAGSRLPSSTC